MQKATILRAPAEEVYADELARLAAADIGPRPEGWTLSPRAVRAFVLGDNAPHSEDSRDFGPIPLSSVLGRVLRWQESGDAATRARRAQAR